MYVQESIRILTLTEPNRERQVELLAEVKSSDDDLINSTIIHGKLGREEYFKRCDEARNFPRKTRAKSALFVPLFWKAWRSFYVVELAFYRDCRLPAGSV